MEKLEKESKDLNRESWLYAFALDTDEDEKEKGITIACGKAFFETPQRRFTILDAPGHKNFVPNMISGAAQADVAILIISARKGEFETGFEKGGQTREHATLIKTLGIRRLIVAINKMDDITVQWSKERFDEITDKLTPFLKGVGFNMGTDVHFLPISGFTGWNLKEKVTKEICPWFEGLPLLQYLNDMTLWERNIDGPFMMPIAEKFKDNGTIIGGKVECGKVSKGQSLYIMPGKRIVEVIGISIEDAELKTAYCGDNVKLKLKGIEEEEVFTGNVACDIKTPVQVSTVFKVQIAILNCKNIVSPGYTAVLHAHMCSEEVSFTSFENIIDRKTGKPLAKRPFAKQGELVIAILTTKNGICIEPFDKHPQLGRFSLRDEGKTVAMGKILEIIA